jgi:hypothetical protein
MCDLRAGSYMSRIFEPEARSAGTLGPPNFTLRLLPPF